MDGDFYIMRTTVRGEAWLRLVIQNPFAEESDIAALADRIQQLGRDDVSELTRRCPRDRGL